MWTRRSFLALGAGTLLAAAAPLPALAAESWVVSYLWSRSLTGVLDYRRRVAGILGSPVAQELAVVRGSDGLGLVWDAPADRATIEAAALAHGKALRAALGGSETLTTVVLQSKCAPTFNVSYGAADSEQGALARLQIVGGTLGPEVQQKLTLESTSPGKWQLVYQRYGDEASTLTVATNHSKVLAKHKITATAVPTHAPRVVSVGSAVAASKPAAKPVEKPIESKPAEKPVEVATARLEPAEAKLGAAAETKATAVKPVESKPVESKPVESKPAEKPAEVAAAKPVASKPSPRPLDDLPGSLDTPLRDTINAHIQRLRKRGVVAADETTAWYVQTLHDDRTWAAINADRSLQCASMFKPYVALAFLHRVEEGRVIYGKMSRTKLEAMIQYSDNEATNWAMMTVGGPDAVQRILTQHYGHILKETSIVETIPRSGRTYRNRSSARDYVRFSRALWREELPQSDEIKRLMLLPGRDRLYTGAPSIPPGTLVMNKTGTTSHLCGDFGILVAQSGAGKPVPYAFVGIIEKKGTAPSYGSWVSARSTVIRGVSDLVYRSLKGEYGLV